MTDDHEDPKVATNLHNLAQLHRAQGDVAEAELLYKRALAIYEKTLGQNHPTVATTLEHYAALLRGASRDEEAVAMESRAKAIRDEQS